MFQVCFFGVMKHRLKSKHKSKVEEKTFCTTIALVFSIDVVMESKNKHNNIEIFFTCTLYATGGEHNYLDQQFT